MSDLYIFEYEDAQGFHMKRLRYLGPAAPGFSYYERAAAPGIRHSLHDMRIKATVPREEALAVLMTSMGGGPLNDLVSDVFRDVEQFHLKFDLGYSGPPRSLEPELDKFRHKFITEECDEFMSATNDDEKMDACLDMIYIIVGYMYLRGWNGREGWRRVQEANMLKKRADTSADSKRGSAYDVVKPKGWRAPVLSDLVTPKP